MVNTQKFNDFLHELLNTKNLLKIHTHSNITSAKLWKSLSVRHTQFPAINIYTLLLKFKSFQSQRHDYDLLPTKKYSMQRNDEVEFCTDCTFKKHIAVKFTINYPMEYWSTTFLGFHLYSTIACVIFTWMGQSTMFRSRQSCFEEN